MTNSAMNYRNIFGLTKLKTNMHSKIMLFLPVVAAVLVNASQIVAQQEQKKFRIETESQKSWKAGRDAYERFLNNGGSYRKTSSVNFNGEKSETHLTIQGHLYALSCDLQPLDGKFRCEFRNPKYFAEVSRKAKMETFVLEQVEPIPNTKNGLPFREIMGPSFYKIFEPQDYRDCETNIDCGYYGPYSETRDCSWFNMRDLVIESEAEVDYRGELMLEVKMSFQANIFAGFDEERKAKFIDQKQNCIVIFNPRRFWAIEKMVAIGEYHPLQTEVRTYEFEYVDYQGIPFQRSLKFDWKDVKTQKARFFATFESKYDFDPVDSSTFFLSSFGIPEPDWYTPPKPWWFYTSIVGMVLVVGGAVLVHFGKRLWRAGSAKQNGKQRK
jgi:hypothetical protein